MTEEVIRGSALCSIASSDIHRNTITFLGVPVPSGCCLPFSLIGHVLFSLDLNALC